MEERNQELELLLNAPALPPVITQVECCIKDNMGTYRLSWSSKTAEDSYLVTLYENDAAVGEPAAVSETAYELSHALQQGARYRIGVMPARNTQAEARVDVLSTAVIEFEDVRLTGEYTMCLDYTLLAENVDKVTVRIAGDGKEKDIQLCPYEQELDLRRYGLTRLKEFDLSVGAVCLSEGTPVCQSFDSLSPVKVNMERPQIKSVRMPGVSGASTVCFDITHAGTGLWEKAKAGILLYGDGELIYRSASVEKMRDAYQFGILLENMTFDRNMSLRIYLQADRLTSWESLPQALTGEVPECVGMEYISLGRVRMEIRKALRGFYEYLATSKNGEYKAVLEMGGDTDVLTIPYAPEVRLAYCLGKLTGLNTEKLILKQSAYYVFGDNFPCICRADEPDYARWEEIVIFLSDNCSASGEIAGTYFSLVQKEYGSKTHTSIKLDRAVWDFSEGEVRKKLREDYESFLTRLEELKLSAEEQRRIQDLIGDYLPQSFKEFAYYNYRFADNRMDIFPGLVLRAQYSMYQYVGDDAVSVYENGYTGTFTQEALVVNRQGKLCLDPFVGELSGGTYIPAMKQPMGQGDLSAAGAAGVLDMQFADMQREYVRLFYPDQFSELSEKGSPEVCCNVGLMAASDRATLAAAWKSFQDTGISAADAPIAYFRGRAHVTPCALVRDRGQEKVLPIFTTVGDLRTGQESAAKVKRKGMRIYGFSSNARKWLNDLPLYPGDEIVE